MTPVSLQFLVDAEKLYKQRLLLAYLGQYDDSGLIEGLLGLTDVVADKLADTGNNEALLTGTKQEHKLGRKLVSDLMCQILKGYAENQ